MLIIFNIMIIIISRSKEAQSSPPPFWHTPVRPKSRTRGGGLLASHIAVLCVVGDMLLVLLTAPSPAKCSCAPASALATAREVASRSAGEPCKEGALSKQV
jgi:hypothetical protein